jgi:hypothetical protein
VGDRGGKERETNRRVNRYVSFSAQIPPRRPLGFRTETGAVTFGVNFSRYMRGRAGDGN